MNLMAYSSWLIFLFATSSNAFSEPEQIDDNQVEENLFGALNEIRSDIIRQLNEVKASVDNISVEIKNLTDLVLKKMSSQSENLKEILDIEGALRSYQKSLDSKLKNVISRVKEIEEISKDTRNEIGFCRENFTDLILKKISSQCENEKEILINEENNIASLETSINDSLKEVSKSRELPKTMEGHTYFNTPRMKYDEAVSYCKNHGGKPFILKTQDEFEVYVSLTRQPKFKFWYAWYPVNDIEEEGHVVLYDGTDYEKASYKLQKWDQGFPNDENLDCVSIDTFEIAYWTNCDLNKFALLCQGN